MMFHFALPSLVMLLTATTALAQVTPASRSIDVIEDEVQANSAVSVNGLVENVDLDEKKFILSDETGEIDVHTTGTPMVEKGQQVRINGILMEMDGEKVIQAESINPIRRGEGQGVSEGRRGSLLAR